MSNPERDPWPSVDDPNDEPELCEYCEAMPEEKHHYTCPRYEPNAADIHWCDECMEQFIGQCSCGHEDWRDR